MRHITPDIMDGDGTDPPAKAYRVLIIEENPIIALDLEAMVKEVCNRACLIVGDGDAAIQAIETANFAAAVVDKFIFDVGGQPFEEAFAARGLPFALCTGHGMHEKYELDGSRMVLFKPYNPEQVRAVLNELLAHQSIERALAPAQDFEPCL